MRKSSKKLWEIKKKYNEFKDAVREFNNILCANNGELANLTIIILCVGLGICIVGVIILTG